MLRRQVSFPVDSERLWREITEADAASAWMGARVEWQVTPGGSARFEEEAGSTRAGCIDEVIPGRRLRFRWWPEGEPEDGAGTSEVTYDLQPTDDGTELTITERQVAAAPESAQASAGWSAWDGRLVGIWAHACTRLGACV